MTQRTLFLKGATPVAYDDDDDDSIATYLQKLKLKTKPDSETTSTEAAAKPAPEAISRRPSVLPENPPLFVNTILKSPRKSEDVTETLRNFAKFERKYSKTKLVEKQNALQLFQSSDEDINKSSINSPRLVNIASRQRRQSSKDVISSMVLQSLQKKADIHSDSSNDNLQNVIIDLPSLSDDSQNIEEPPKKLQHSNNEQYIPLSGSNLSRSVFISDLSDPVNTEPLQPTPTKYESASLVSEHLNGESPHLSSSNSYSSVSEHIRASSNNSSPFISKHLKKRTTNISVPTRAPVFKPAEVSALEHVNQDSPTSSRTESVVDESVMDESLEGNKNSATTGRDGYSDTFNSTSSSEDTTVLSMKVVDHSTQTLETEWPSVHVPLRIPVPIQMASAKEVLESSTHLPGMSALNSLLRSQLEMTKLHLSSAQRQYQSSLANITPDYNYTTLRETQKYLHRKRSDHRPKSID